MVEILSGRSIIAELFQLLKVKDHDFVVRFNEHQQDLKNDWYYAKLAKMVRQVLISVNSIAAPSVMGGSML